MFFHPVALDRGTDSQPDLIGADQSAIHYALGDLGEVGLGRGQKLLALAGTLRSDQRVAAHDQPLAGEVLSAGDVVEVLLVEQRRLKNPFACEPVS